MHHRNLKKRNLFHPATKSDIKQWRLIKPAFCWYLIRFVRINYDWRFGPDLSCLVETLCSCSLKLVLDLLRLRLFKIQLRFMKTPLKIIETILEFVKTLLTILRLVQTLFFRVTGTSWDVHWGVQITKLVKII